MSYASESRAYDDSGREGSIETGTAVIGTVAGDRELTAELFVRSLAPIGMRPRQHAVLERLDRLARDDRLRTYTVTVWGTGICLNTATSGTEAGRATLETIEEFEQWAAERDLRFRAGFERRTIGSIATERETTVIEFPMMCLAVRESGALRCVAPCSDTDGDIEHSIIDCLEELAGNVETSDHSWS